MFVIDISMGKNINYSSLFVVLPPHTKKDSVIFGKNSDRFSNEIQELIYEAPKQYPQGELLKCTFIEIKQVEQTYGVILNKPEWMWGCEMGANDQGVVIGNGVAVKANDCDRSLLGTDLVRLALERSKTAEESVDVITNLITNYEKNSLGVYNSFLICDAKEAWVLEVVGTQWVAQKISSGFRNISGNLSIGTEFHKSSTDLLAFAKEKNLWNGEGNFNFAEAFSVKEYKPSQKYLAGQELLKKQTEKNNFGVKDMFVILRDKQNDICSGISSNFPTTASQVSVLSKNRPCCHWFTATPDPTVSVFKPFIFTPDVKISSHTKCSEGDDRSHVLHKLHVAATSDSNNKVISLLQDMEQNCLEEVETFLDDFHEGQHLSEVDELLKDIVETEVKFYK